MTQAPNRILVEDDAEDQRLDRWFKAHYPDLPRARLEKLLRTGQIRIDGARAKSGTRLQAGQELRLPPGLSASVSAESAVAASARAQPPSLQDQQLVMENILYRDQALVVFNKPRGLAVQGGTGQKRSLDAILRTWPKPSEGPDFSKLRLVHRLDRDTSGVLVLAQGAKNASSLTRAFHDKMTRKFYWAAVIGKPEKPRGYIDMPLAALSGRGGDKTRADPQGQEALTLYRLVAHGRLNGVTLSWLVLMPVTGRKHQLRAHLASLRLPILGDGKYGGRKSHPEQLSSRPWAGKLHLHAREIAIPHPDDGTTLRVSAPLPDEMRAAWHDLGWQEDHGTLAVNDLTDYSESLLPRLEGAGKHRQLGRKRGGTRASK